MRETYRDIIEVDKKRQLVDLDYAKAVCAKPGFYLFDERFRSVLGLSPELTCLETRDFRFAHEAGVYHKETNSIYFTSNYSSGSPIKLYRVHCESHEVEELDYPEVIQANGACQHKGNILYCAQGDLTHPSSLIEVNPVTGDTKTLINNFFGREFSSINDVVVHHGTGDIWFTDPTYGFEQGFRKEAMLPNQVYRFNPETGELCVVADQFDMCNGLCFNHDYTKMYVTDTGALKMSKTAGSFVHNPKSPSVIYEYDVVDKKRLFNKRVFAFCDDGIPDGIKCDIHGNVYSGCGHGIHVWNPDGILIGKIITGEVCANFCFSASGMWIFSEFHLFFCSLGTKGALVNVECY
ncbi:hypothetical protein KL918_003854 [Ogataea parapolymorpha]|uniref:Lactonohydrolase n=1 Tax=Ogataea parapolymorpha (strain ATCC 26012 / BCRC 20466 / JCM 22074 / NRRL Y-7560 / DL-1) TaxID=871575 RepID=W1QKB4_OGAPD|nr:putative lactonohydrolase [Ogataea parapolymorpha DL-1]ESX02307.1 putative lactonohydrolase [Ogataea parapolymorpha DL-1]KAG7866389.1 hypothetical protein KL918_003854 [Ogataea parapolymorpha]KAG7873017.1 hypothetical protein KL916_002747 [Ogataea parapolymorpha]